jgi:hypothetical protein
MVLPIGFKFGDCKSSVPCVIGLGFGFGLGLGFGLGKNK